MKKVEQSVLVLACRDPKFMDTMLQVIGLRASSRMAHVFEILQGSTDFCPMVFCLAPDVF
ncbi:MAG: hypothetical protein WC881_04745 [Elusimicrobiota bacterium]